MQTQLRPPSEDRATKPATDVFTRLKSAKKLPSPPGVAIRILELTRSDETTITDIANAISSDPALAARTLKFINSPMASAPRRVSTLHEAVNQIGLRCVQMIALSFSLVSSKKEGGCPSFDYSGFWSVSLARAVAARLIARHTRLQDPDEAFICGLLSCFGQLVLACGLPEEYERALKAAKREPNRRTEIEQAEVGTTHWAVGVGLLREWQLPQPIWETIDSYSETSGAPDADPSLPDPAKHLHTADLTAALLTAEKVGIAQAEGLARVAERYFESSHEVWSELFDQIAQEWRAYGKLLSVHTREVRSFSDILDEAREQMAELSIATQLENRSIRSQSEQWQHKAATDALTDVANRATFDARLADEIKAAERDLNPVLLLMMDIDHFKKFNDTHGHLAGDHVLKTVAKTLSDNVRKDDLVSRYGGEEFAVIARNCRIPEAAAIADDLRRAVEQTSVEWQDQSLKVTLSVGGALAHWPDAPRSPEELIRLADAQLYAAKRAGRNRCSFAEQPAVQETAETPDAPAPGDGAAPVKRGFFARLFGG